MRRYSNCAIWSIALLLLIFSPGCCSPGASPVLAAPTVVSVVPLSAAVGVCPNAPVTAAFSAAMNPATINSTTFTLTGPDAASVSGVVTYNASSDTATFTPSSALALSTSYTATITTGAIDASGVALASNLVWSFTTSSEACAPPTVISVTPVLTVGVCPSTAVTATFSEAMNPATINTTTFTLTGPGTTPVAGVVTYAASTATFTPTSALTVSTLYTATITTGAQNLNGNALANNYTWSFTTASAACAPPTVISVAPPDGATGICQNTLVVATFSEAMNPSTINTTTFTLAASGTPVAGTVTYDVSSYAATFTPTSPLALDTTYTAAITTGAQDLAGVALASNYPWSFTTAATACTTVPTVPMGTACNFGVLGATPVVSSIGDTAVTGDVGIWPGLSITGFPPGTATALEPGNAAAATAQADLTTAYNYAAAVPGGAILPADIGMETLTPGVYKTTSAQPSLGITGNLTLSGSGVYIFQIVSTLTTAATNSQVILAGGATSQDVFWQVGSSATLGTYTTFQGIIMAKASVTVGVGATLDGSALAETGAVSMDDNIVVTPPCQ